MGKVLFRRPYNPGSGLKMRKKMKNKGNYIKSIAAIGIGAALMFVLMRFLPIPTGVPDTNINFGIPVLAVFSAIYGPIVGFCIGFLGHMLVDLTWGGVWWSWVLSSAFFGFAIGFFRKFFKIEAGGFGVRQAVFFNVVQAAANITAYVFIARILDLLIYNESFEKLTLQGFVAAGINIAAVLILGTLPVIVYSKIRAKAGSPDSGDTEELKNESIKNISNFAKAIWVRLVLGMFFVSALMTLLISEMVDRQMNNYKTTVTEVTGHHLTSAVLALSQLVSAEELDLFYTVEDMQRPEYEEIRERLIKFGEDNHVLYAYYWRDYGNGKLQYIVDNDTDPKTQVGPGDFNDISHNAEREALAGNISVADLGSYSPGWEKLLSAHAPVYDGEGNVYCVAGVDISDDFILIQRQDARKMTLLQLIVVPISVIFGIVNMLLYRRKTKQIEEAHVKLQYFNNNLRRAFSTYLSEDVVEEIVSNPTRLQLGGEKRYMTALFTDIQGFTRIAEALSPEQLVELLNYYLSTMSDVILEKEGTIDKYEGDAIVAFFGAPLYIPDHALRACMTAIIMKRLETEVNMHISKQNLSPSPLHTRIGINSGDMVVGNMGTQKKMNYTIVSNAVNMAARLEGVNKQYGTWVLASEETINETQGRLLARRLDRVRVVGINEPVRIYEVVETNADAPRALHDKIELFNNAHELFEAHRWNDAIKEFNRILKEYPKDGPSLLYLDRCQKYLQYPPIDGWDGVYNFDEK